MASIKLTPKTYKALKWHLKQYCSFCGGKLHIVDKKIHEYNTITGEPHYKYTIQCENYRWWKLLTFHENTRYLVYNSIFMGKTDYRTLDL